uniref:Alcohol dehydrogenase [NADP(+)] B n=1 Tax=Lygus hesperus TaxID=30085 RepID=A0A0A9VXL0_LYGHE
MVQPGRAEKMVRINRITMVAYSPLGSPNRPTHNADDPVLMEDPVIVRIAKEYNKTTAQIILRYSIQRGVVVIPQSKNCRRMSSNIRIFDFELSEKDMEDIRCLEKGFPYGFLQFKLFNAAIKSKYYPFNGDF